MTSNARIKLALYDPSQISDEGTFWSWRAPGLDRHLLDGLYYTVAAANRPEAPNELDHSTIIGGFASVPPDWVFVYRFGNGGRDGRGRPGRFVMVVAGLRGDQRYRCDLAAILTCDTMNEILADARQMCPVPAPGKLELDVAGAPKRVDPVLVSRTLRCGRLELNGQNALIDGAGVCASLTVDRPWTCLVRLKDGIGKAVVTCPPVEEAIATKLSATTKTHLLTSEEVRPSRGRFAWVFRAVIGFILLALLVRFYFLVPPWETVSQPTEKVPLDTRVVDMDGQPPAIYQDDDSLWTDEQYESLMESDDAGAAIPRLESSLLVLGLMLCAGTGLAIGTWWLLRKGGRRLGRLSSQHDDHR